jgi:hypothetical protein
VSRRKNADKPAEQPVHKPPTRVPRRKRRRPSGAKPQPPQASARAVQHDDLQDGYPLHDTWPTPVKTSRAPRPVEPPPPNPNVFSYTFTIWKST